MSKSDFDLANSKWYNAAGIERTTKWLHDDAESLVHYAWVLLKHAYDPAVSTDLKSAESTLIETLASLREARIEYEKLKVS